MTSSYHEIFLKYKKEWTVDSCDNMDESAWNYSEWKDNPKQSHTIYMWFYLNNIFKWQNYQNGKQNRDHEGLSCEGGREVERLYTGNMRGSCNDGNVPGCHIVLYFCKMIPLRETGARVDEVSV